MARARRQLTPELYRENVCDIIYNAGKQVYLNANRKDVNAQYFEMGFLEQNLHRATDGKNAFNVDRLTDYARQHKDDFTADEGFLPYHQLFMDLAERVQDKRRRYDVLMNHSFATYNAFRDASMEWGQDHAARMEALFKRDQKPLTQFEMWVRRANEYYDPNAQSAEQHVENFFKAFKNKPKP